MASDVVDAEGKQSTKEISINQLLKKYFRLYFSFTFPIARQDDEKNPSIGWHLLYLYIA